MLICPKILTEYLPHTGHSFTYRIVHHQADDTVAVQWLTMEPILQGSVPNKKKKHLYRLRAILHHQLLRSKGVWDMKRVSKLLPCLGTGLRPLTVHRSAFSTKLLKTTNISHRKIPNTKTLQLY